MTKIAKNAKSLADKLAATAAATEGRKRFSFGKVWIESVIAGKVTDQAKLVEHAVKLKVAARSDAKRALSSIKSFENLRAKVAAALVQAQAAQAQQAAEGSNDTAAQA